MKQSVEGVALLLGSQDEASDATKEAHRNRKDGHQSEAPQQMFKAQFMSHSSIFFDRKLRLVLIHC